MSDNRVAWIGTSDHFVSPRTGEEPTHAMAICEEAVLDTAFNPLYAGLTRLSKDAAVICSYRYALRTALEGTDLNPEWSPAAWDGRRILKGPASCMNSDVWHLHESRHVKRLRLYVPGSLRGVLERHVQPPQWEVDGFVLNGEVHELCTLIQTWNWKRNVITAYDQIPRSMTHAAGSIWRRLKAATQQAIETVKLDNSPFCIEFRIENQQAKVIDMHARLGEDDNLAALMGGDPLHHIERIVRTACKKPTTVSPLTGSSV